MGAVGAAAGTIDVAGEGISRQTNAATRVRGFRETGEVAAGHEMPGPILKAGRLGYGGTDGCGIVSGQQAGGRCAAEIRRQHAHRVRQRIRDECQPLLHRRAADAQRKGDVGKVGIGERPGVQCLGKVARALAQARRIAGGKNDQLRAKCCGRLRRRRIVLQHRMRVDPAEAEAADARPQRQRAA